MEFIEIINSLKNLCEVSDNVFEFGRFQVSFMKFKPTISLERLDIPISYMFDSCELMMKEYLENGIALKLTEHNFRIVDYFKFLKRLLKDNNIQIIDNQEGKAGSPDFKLIFPDKKIIWIEMKYGNTAAIGAHQLKWMLESNEEVWYMVIENIRYNPKDSDDIMSCV